VKNRKVQVYCVLGSKVSSVVAEHLEHSLPGQTQAPARLIFAPQSSAYSRPPHSPGFGPEVSSLIRFAHKAALNAFPRQIPYRRTEKQKMQTEPQGVVCCRMRLMI
jgi:hypothetical protein